MRAEKQQGLFAPPPPPSDADRARAKRLETMIAKVCEVVRAGFDGNDVVVMRKVNPANAGVLADQLDVIEKALAKLRLELRAAGAVRATTR